MIVYQDLKMCTTLEPDGLFNALTMMLLKGSKLFNGLVHYFFDMILMCCVWVKSCAQ